MALSKHGQLTQRRYAAYQAAAARMHTHNPAARAWLEGKK